MNTIFTSWIGLSINKIFFKVWPPEGEENISDFDINLCVSLDKNNQNVYEIYRDRDDIWTPLARKSELPDQVYSWSVFKLRMENWMKSTIDSVYTYEYYELNTSSYFHNIINNKIQKILLIYVNSIEDPFGLKICTDKDYILSIPNADGSTIITKKFNQNNKLENFKSLGKIYYKAI